LASAVESVEGDFAAVGGLMVLSVMDQFFALAMVPAVAASMLRWSRRKSSNVALGRRLREGLFGSGGFDVPDVDVAEVGEALVSGLWW